MSFAWIFALARRAGFLALPLAFATVGAIGFVLPVLLTEGGSVRRELPPSQLWGPIVMFTGLPAYLIAMIPLVERQTRRAIAELASLVQDDDVARVHERSARAPRWALAAFAVGPFFGMALNPIFMRDLMAPGGLHALDVAFIVAASTTWVVVGLLLSWFVPVGRALSLLGERARVDLYRLDQLRPLARLANLGLLVTAGAMAFTPLQSLDAQFRWGNYLPAVIVGVPSGVFLFLLPLWGVRRTIRRAKTERLAELRAAVDGFDRADVRGLEALAAHVDRVRSIPNWPVDVELLPRLLGSVVIPPLAWIAAALVENLIDRL